MKLRFKIILLTLLALPSFAKATVQLIEFGESGLSLSIPDNSLAGLARIVEVSGYELKAPYVVTVSMKITGTGYGAWNGDYYADLRHTSVDGTMTQLAVLLNRVGRSYDMPSGYSDNGFDVTFSDSADDDIHNYRFTLGGGHNNPITGLLTGTWQPDRRTADPLEVLDTSLRTTTLNALGAGSPNGTWTLFLADTHAGGTGQLVDWQVKLEGVPEPSSGVLLALGGWLFLSLIPRRRLPILK